MTAADFAPGRRGAGALASGCGLVVLEGFAAHEATGTQAVGYLHRMLTQDVRSLAVGGGRPALLLDAKGRVQGDPFVWRTADRLVLAMDPAAAAKAMPTLLRYVIADDVSWADASGRWTHALLLGPSTPQVLERSAPAVAALGGLLARADLRERPAARLLAPAASAARVHAALLDAGAVVADAEAFEVARVETGTPWYGAELDDRVLPNEAGLDAAISWTKGCYLGQEPVVMARHRGHPPSLLVRLSIEGDAPPPRDAALSFDGRPAGRVTTAVRVGAGRVLALGYVRHDLARVGSTLLMGEGSARGVVGAVFGA